MTLGAVLLVYPFLARTGKPLIIDSYDPFLLAGLELYRGRDLPEQITRNEHYRRAHLRALHAADVILCASERQRDYWLGMISALGRVNPHTYAGDPTLRRLVRVVPFGLPSEPPRSTRRVMKGVHPGIGESDRVVLWGGGLWQWLDPQTAIRAMARVAQSAPDVKLFFMGTRRPNPEVARQMTVAEEAETLSRDLGLTGRNVFFNDWVAYADRQNFLLEADLGISLHRDVVETRFAFRTRVLDCVWAGLPLVATEGDTLSQEMRQEGLGATVPPGDERAVADALLGLLDTPLRKADARPRFEALARRYRWEAVAEPLVEFCCHPYVSPDKGRLATFRTDLMSPFSWRTLPARAWGALKRRAGRRS
jgi:glycosyltransferase involved in cell wall biosynthesis